MSDPRPELHRREPSTGRQAEIDCQRRGRRRFQALQRWTGVTSAYLVPETERSIARVRGRGAIAESARRPGVPDGRISVGVLRNQPDWRTPFFCVSKPYYSQRLEKRQLMGVRVNLCCPFGLQGEARPWFW